VKNRTSFACSHGGYTTFVLPEQHWCTCSAKKFIDDAIGTRGRVLVHCNGKLSISSFVTFDVRSSVGGISLSPAFVVMFVMQHYQLSWEDALHLVQNRRYCISPNGGFLTQIKVHLTTSSSCRKQFISWSLQEYEAIYKASLAVQSFPAAKKVISRRKREEGQDDDMQIRYVHI